ncbi:MAG: PEP-utilizing enzyme [Actinomycetes bacterium]
MTDTTATPLGTGTTVFTHPPVSGTWRMLDTPDDVLDLMDEGAEGIVAGVQDAGATFLAPIFHELTAVVCFSGTPMSHIGIVSREYRVPCIMATEMAERPVNGTPVEVDCTDGTGVVRSLG